MNPSSAPAQQRVVTTRRDYNSWVARESDRRLRAALHAALVPQVEPLARGQHRLRRGLVPDPRSGGRDAAGAVRLRQRGAGDPGHRARDLPGRAADQRLRRAPRRRHGPADPRRRLRLHRQHHHQPHLRQLHLHLLRARSGGDGLRAGAGLRHPARLGLPAVRAGGDPAGHARRHRHQPAADVDAAAVAADAGGAFRLRVRRAPGHPRRPGQLRRCRRHARRLRAAGLRGGHHGGHRAHHADGRAGRLPAFHARAAARAALALVGRGAGRRPGLGAAGRAEDAGRRAAGLPGAVAHGAGRPRGRPEPDVPGGLRAGVLALRARRGGHRRRSSSSRS